MSELVVAGPGIENDELATEVRQCTIAELEIGQTDPVLEAKVYRKWVARNANETTETDFCCILLDREGNAIHAFMNLDDYNYFNAKLDANKVYRITDFFCEATNTYMQTLENRISLSFGRVTSFVPLSGRENEFPDHHFELVPYAELSTRIPYPDPVTSRTVYPRLTDFLGRMRSISELLPYGNPGTRQGHLRKVSMESLDGNVVDLTMWGALAAHFNKEEYDKIAFPAILIITSCRVSRFGGILQLAATSATYYYINPETAVVDEAKRLFQERYNQQPPLEINRYRSANIEDEMQRNRQTLGVLLAQIPANFEGVRFTCEAAITGYISNRAWNYASCIDCSQSSRFIDGVYVCKDHGRQFPTPYRYNFKATVNDGTANAEFTFFTEAGEKITGVSCTELRTKQMETGQRSLPAEMTAAIGKPHIFPITFAGSTQQGAGRFIVKDVLDLPPLPKQEKSGLLAITQSPDALNEETCSRSLEYPSKQAGTSTDNKDSLPGTPKEDVIELVARTIVETVKPTIEKPEDTAKPTTETSSAKRALMDEFSTADSKKKKTD